MDIGFILTVIWPYLAALYLLDCILFVRGSHLLFTGTASSGFRVRRPGLRLAGMMPWDWSILTVKDPLILSETGIYSRTESNPNPFKPPGQDDFELILWEEVELVRAEGKRVLVNNRSVLLATSGAEASACCRRILQLRELPAEERIAAIKKDLASVNDLETIGKELETAKGSGSFLIGISVVLFFLTLFLLPVSLLFRLPPPVLWLEITVFVMGWVTTMVLWWRAHQVLFPDCGGDRLEEMFVFLFFPVSTLHAFSKLTRRLFAGSENTALIAVLAPTLTRETLEKEHIRATAAASSIGTEDFTTVWKMRVRMLENLAGKTRVNLTGEELISDEPGPGETVCPLCGAHYREGVKECADCRIPLGAPRVSLQTVNEGVCP